MNISKKSFLGKIDFKRKGREYTLGTGPESDWRLIFISTLVLAVLVVATSAFIFIEIERGGIFTIKDIETEEARTLNISKLAETVDYYEYKAGQFERIKNSNTVAVDPSL